MLSSFYMIFKELETKTYTNPSQLISCTAFLLNEQMIY